MHPNLLVNIKCQVLGDTSLNLIITCQKAKDN